MIIRNTLIIKSTAWQLIIGDVTKRHDNDKQKKNPTQGKKKRLLYEMIFLQCSIVKRRRDKKTHISHEDT